MLVLGLDFETTGLKTDTDRVWEVGAILWDWKARQPLRIFSALVWGDNPADGYPDIHEAHKVRPFPVDPERILTMSISEGRMLKTLEMLSESADAILAHNGARFDYHVWRGIRQRHGRDNPEEIGKLLLDSTVDVPYPEEIKTRNLTHLAAEHGFINPFPHRALPDVLTMFQVVGGYDIDAIVRRAKEPKVFLLALVSFDDKHKAKDAGFMWQAEGAPNKSWSKSLPESEAKALAATLDFPTRIHVPMKPALMPTQATPPDTQ